ncbi:MAG: hypothetical protein A3B71_06070 [Gammaproteobacteria bacterium RIFCSPHIGHO2_02_FULL_42_43]|nr:MAG: hypothetical protein A3B71_06070 [Gammaproteobacteria bacterium RIFCSPHIGHO2_02_FULL_42_43]
MHFPHEDSRWVEWHNLLIEAQEKSGHTLIEPVEHYVLITLDAYTAQLKLATSALAIEFLENVHVNHVRDFQKLRSVGDQCLILAGLFPERAIRKRVSRDYFTHLGENAYYILSYAQVPIHIDHSLFYLLSENFSDLVQVLQAMRWVNDRIQ